MDAAQIQAKAYYGMAKAASILGYPFSLYRQTSPVAVVTGAAVATLPASFSVGNPSSAAPRGYGKSDFVCLVDGSQTQPGDYLVEAAAFSPGAAPRTFFIAAMEPLLAILAIQCNRIITIKRMQTDPVTASTAAPDWCEIPVTASIPYGGDNASLETPVMTGFPCSMLEGSRGDKADSGLPDATRQPWWIVLLPAIAGTEILTDDVAYDDYGLRYKISSAELTDKGWRMNMILTEA
jgi:hypothetical protein